MPSSDTHVPARSQQPSPGPLEDFLYESFFAAAIGGSAVALFFLVVDTLAGRPFFTPSLLGTVLFLGVPAEAATEIRLDMVARYTVVHFVVFGAVGVALTFIVHHVERHVAHPLFALTASFAFVELGSVGGAAIFLPGVMGGLGPVWVALANLLAAVSMGLFFVYARRPDLWVRLKSGSLGRSRRASHAS